MIQTRTKIHELFKDRNIQIGAELGVANGWYSSYLNRHHKFKEFYCIDKWNDHHDDKERLNVIETFKNQDNVKILHMEFQEAINLFPDEYFDFIYIDGYAHTGQNDGLTLRQWYPKLKSGGTFSGHDYTDMPPSIEVKRAVDEFASKHNLDIQKTVKGKFPSWFTTKP